MPVFNYDYLSPTNKVKVKEVAEFCAHVESNLTVKCLKKAYIIPYANPYTGGVILDSLQRTLSSDFKDKYELDLAKVQNKRMAILIGDFFLYVWGHCFTDHFRKLWFIFTDECKKLQSQGAELVYLSVQPNVPKYFHELFALAGFDLHKAEMITELTQYDELFIPDDCTFIKKGYFHRYYTNEYVCLLNRMKDTVKRLALSDKESFPKFEKIYLSRTQGNFEKVLRDIGEVSVEKVFRNEGFRIIAPEKYTVAQQIWMMMNCKCLCSTDGSIAHNSLFCSSHTDMILLQKADFLTENIIAAAYIANLNITFVPAHKSVFCNKVEPCWGPFFVCVTKNLENYIGHNVGYVPFYLLPKFYVYCLREMYVRSIKKIPYCDKIVKKILNMKVTSYTKE